ncbi:hypothetical protein P280DRAFT_14491 [Massarina eburnea CBS 473.64]|uniref:Zn(2)-C6 fungal-type domain-containing protein n=1 Tax=Massarina eburnea CBS 473.64 TaxID=1395130 RepID=A0A6A6SGC6_9PLEO|nr:hypothetical protein P280DRAFT_14491 [Massarina eburnea CBS 473.64]
MGFSGKLSKGCLPCRQKRTKCDLLLPSCTQCIRKNRICTGYRKEQDLVFRNETAAIVQKTARRRGDQRLQLSFQGALALQLMNGPPLQPSRSAFINDEAIVHYLNHYNKKIWATSGRFRDGFDYATHVIQSDISRGGPVAEIVRACGLASLGNSTGSAQLVTSARAKQIKVLQQLNRQLHDPQSTLSDSSILTCILLSTFEGIISDSPIPNAPYMAHLNGAAKLLAMRGQTQFSYDIGYGIWLKLRNDILSECLRSREPVPEFVCRRMEAEAIEHDDHYPDFFQLITFLCRLLSEHKTKGYVDEAMVTRAHSMKVQFEYRCAMMRNYVSEERPSVEEIAHETDPEVIYLFQARVNSWIFIHCVRALISDIFIEYARQRDYESPGALTLHALEIATNEQTRSADMIENSVAYYLEKFATSTAATRVQLGVYMMWPLSVLASLSAASSASIGRIVKYAEKISDEYGLRMAKTMAESMESKRRLTEISELPLRPKESETGEVESLLSGGPSDTIFP